MNCHEVGHTVPHENKFVYSEKSNALFFLHTQLELTLDISSINASMIFFFLYFFCTFLLTRVTLDDI